MRIDLRRGLQDLVIETERLSIDRPEESAGLRTWELVSDRGHDRARWLLGFDQDLVRDLRSALAFDGIGEIWRLSDSEIRRMAIDRISSGRWRMYTRSRHGPAAAYPRTAGSTSGSSAPVVLAPDVHTPATRQPDAYRSPKKAAATPDAQRAGTTPPATVPPGVGLHWIEIELVGEDGLPIPDEAYRIRLPDGQVVEGLLDAAGFARIGDLPKEGSCEVCFPRLDGAAWEFVESRPARAST